MNTSRDNRSAPPGTRRRLLRGALAVPALMTVHSGSVLANASNMRCIAKQSGTFPPVTTGIPAGDTFVRVQLAELRPNGGGQPSTFYVVGASVADVNRAPSYTLGASQWQVFNIGTNTDVGGAVLSSQPTGNGNSASYIEQSGKFAALRFNAQGQVTGVGVGPEAWAVTGSCWTSFAAAG